VVRYLVVIPGNRNTGEAAFHDLDSEFVLEAGDELVVSDLLVRVRAAIDVPADDGYDGTLVCTSDDC
jgi:hypothetical protein